LPRIFLINPSVVSFGYSLMAPRWLFVIAQATPSKYADNLTIIDESIKRFDSSVLNQGDIIGIGITTGNCARGYQIIKEAKKIGALVIVGGIHATIFPDEPIEQGADAVITGNGDLVWPKAIDEAMNGDIKERYVGGRVSGDKLLPAKWDLMNPKMYLTASVQTIAGCPENCSFCSVWVTDGRKVRQRLNDKVISEVNQLYAMGFRFIIFADDNFNPATLGRISRETSKQKREELERIRGERLEFFEEYSRQVPADMYGFTQMTSELASDPEYLDAMYAKMRIRGGLVGIESFSEEGLANVNKQWNPVGHKMVNAIATIRKRGISILGSIICGLGSDTTESIQTMRSFVFTSGVDLAQFIIYSPYPGTVDFSKMQKEGSLDRDDINSLLYEKFWLDPEKPAVLFKHPGLASQTIIDEVKKSWNIFYSFNTLLRRAWDSKFSGLGKLWYLLASLAFKYFYSKDGISADNVRSQHITFIPALIMRMGVYIFNYWLRRPKKPIYNSD
jgi:radical SAM superfamily enzyme YgiQ (UPF0313 family)